jgi:hypothetical protein
MKMIIMLMLTMSVVSAAGQSATGLTDEQKAKRTKMLKWHKALGLVTVAGMAAQGYVGTRLFDGKPVASLHKSLAFAVYGTYITTASLILLVPKPEEKLPGKFKLHRNLALVHLAGMGATFVLGELTAHEHPELKRAHRAVAVGTFLTLGTAAFVMTF